jgi:hypothetical protein
MNPKSFDAVHTLPELEGAVAFLKPCKMLVFNEFGALFDLLVALLVISSLNESAVAY